MFVYPFVYLLVYLSPSFSPLSPLPPYRLNKSFPSHLTTCSYHPPTPLPYIKHTKSHIRTSLKKHAPLTKACMQTHLFLLAQNEGKEIRETDGLLSTGIYISLLLRRFLCETEVRSLIPSRSGVPKNTPVFHTRPSHP